MIATRVRQPAPPGSINHVRAEAQRMLRYTDTTATERRPTHHRHRPGRLQRRPPASPTPSWVSLAHCGAATAPASTPATASRSTPASEILAAERRILAAAAPAGGRVADGDSSPPRSPNAAPRRGGTQRRPGRPAARHGHLRGRAQLALAPAGTGKTTAMAALGLGVAQQRRHRHRTRPDRRRGEVLGADLGAPTDTIDKLVHSPTCGGGPPPAVDDPARTWFDAIDADTLIIVDEAGNGRHRRPGRGDHPRPGQGRQRAPDRRRQAAGVDLGRRRSARHRRRTRRPHPVRSRAIHRPDHRAAEGAASLALRDGDPAGIALLHRPRPRPCRRRRTPPPTWPTRPGRPTSRRPRRDPARPHQRPRRRAQRPRPHRTGCAATHPATTPAPSTLADGLHRLRRGHHHPQATPAGCASAGDGCVRNGYRWVISDSRRRRHRERPPTVRHRARIMVRCPPTTSPPTPPWATPPPSTAPKA